jgi:hypothetical protein
LRGATCDLCSGSGLTANRINLRNASELYPAFDLASRSPRPALCYRPLLAFFRHFAVRKRLSSSPGRRTNRKNLRNCQRTIIVLLLLNFQSMKSVRIYVLCFQRSAAGSQAGDSFWCSCNPHLSQRCAANAAFMALNGTSIKLPTVLAHACLCISRETGSGQGFSRFCPRSAAPKS